MIAGAHVLLYSKDPETDRAFFKTVLEFPLGNQHESSAAQRRRDRPVSTRASDDDRSTFNLKETRFGLSQNLYIRSPITDLASC